MHKKLLFMVLVILCFVSIRLTSQGGTVPSSTIKVGDYLQMGKYYGEPILWKCVALDTESITLVSEYILCLKAYDAAESGAAYQGSDDVQTWGSNIWSNSNIREWLNSSAQTVSFTTHAPVKSAVWDNAYADESGFLSNFTQAERDGIKAVNHNGITDKVFLLSVDEVNQYLGDTDSKRMKIITNTGIQKNNVEFSTVGNYGYYWTRSPFPGYSYLVQYVGSDGFPWKTYACYGTGGIAPALLISPYIPINGTGTLTDPWGSPDPVYSTMTGSGAINEYLYDTGDTGDTISISDSGLASVIDVSTAKSSIVAVTDTMSVEQKNSATGIDLLTLFGEEVIAQVASYSVLGNRIVINQENFQGLMTSVISTKTVVGDTLVFAGIIPVREMDAGVKYKTTETNNVTITVEPLILNVAINNIQVGTPDFAVSFSAATIKANASNSPLIVTITENASGALETIGTGSRRSPVAIASISRYAFLPTTSNYADLRIYNENVGFRLANNNSGHSTITNPSNAFQNSDIAYTTVAATGSKTYTVTFNKQMTENVKLSLPPIEGNTDFQAVTRSNGTAIGGKYNPATGMLDVNIKDSDTYTVKMNQKDFADIQKKSNEMKNAIRVLASKGIIGGTSATTFSPDSTITRAEIAALIVRTLSKLDPNSNGGFVDVKKTDWFYGASGSAKRFGIMNGTSATIFAPKKNILKDQIVAVAARTIRTEMKYRNPVDMEKYLGSYLDRGSLPSWGTIDFALATRENLVVKRTDGKFSPAGTMSRGDAAIILYRMFMKIW